MSSNSKILFQVYVRRVREKWDAWRTKSSSAWLPGNKSKFINFEFFKSIQNNPKFKVPKNNYFQLWFLEGIHNYIVRSEKYYVSWYSASKSVLGQACSRILRKVYGVGERPLVQLLLQSACTSLCRHIYDWNIVECDVKQLIHSITSSTTWYDP